MNNENKNDVPVSTEAKNSNARALYIVIGFVVLFVGLIAFEIASKK